MRYYRLLTEDGYEFYDIYVIGRIYREDFKDSECGNSVEKMVSEFPKDWEEVSEEEYLKQKGLLSDLSECSFYEKELALTLESIKNKLGIKSEEYSISTDKLHNFNEGAIRLKCTPERCLEAYNTKHLVSYADMLDKLDKGVIPSNDYIDEKLGDIINYFILQKIQLKQRNNED